MAGAQHAASSNGLPAIWKASGRPFSNPIGTDNAGKPVMLYGAVYEARSKVL